MTFTGEKQERTSLHFRRYHFKWSKERCDDLLGSRAWYNSVWWRYPRIAEAR